MQGDDEEQITHEEEEEEEEDMIIPKTPESHPWMSLGSEQEIEEESVTASRPRVRHGMFLKAIPEALQQLTCVFLCPAQV